MSLQVWLKIHILKFLLEDLWWTFWKKLWTQLGLNWWTFRFLFLYYIQQKFYFLIKRPCGKKNTKVRITQKNRKRTRKLIPKNEEISGQKAHTNTQKLNWNVSTITDVFLNQKRVNVCEHMVKMAPSESCVHIHLLSSDRETHLWSSKCFN